MPRPRWPHLLREVSRHGTVRWVVRRGHGPRTVISSRGGEKDSGPEYGTPAFLAAYNAAIQGEASVRTGESATGASGQGTLAWLIARYQDSSSWTSLDPWTRKQRGYIYKQVSQSAGETAYKAITKAHIIAGRERRAKTPFQANSFLSCMGALFKWAVKNDFLVTNPTVDVDKLKTPSDGFRPAEEDEIARFREHWPLGTRERLALEILLNTGLRRGDAAKLGRQHVRGSFIVMRTEKTKTEVKIPVNDDLAEALRLAPVAGLTYIAQENGAPLTKESLGFWFHDATRAAGVLFSAHGLRKAAAARLIDLGLTDAELEQVMGWRPGSRMTGKYTTRRNADALAARAAAKVKAEGIK